MYLKHIKFWLQLDNLIFPGPLLSLWDGTGEGLVNMYDSHMYCQLSPNVLNSITIMVQQKFKNPGSYLFISEKV